MKAAVFFTLIISVFFSSALMAQVPSKIWDHSFGSQNKDVLVKMVKTPDGGLMLGGYSGSFFFDNYDYWIIKIDAEGEEQWEKKFAGNKSDQLIDLVRTADGGFLLGGESTSDAGLDKTGANKGLNDMWIIKTDSLGTKQWDITLGGTGQDNCYSVAQVADGSYIVAGTSYSGISGDVSQENRGESDYWIVKLDTNGVKQWDARFGGASYEDLYSIEPTNDGGYILSGSSYSDAGGDKSEDNKGGIDYWIVKLDADGMKEWDSDFGGDGYEDGPKTLQTPDGGYIVAGYSSSGVSGDRTQPSWGGDDFWMVKTDANGMKQWDARYGGDDWEYLGDIQLTMDGGYILGGSSYSGISGDKTQADIEFDQDYWAIKTDSNGIPEWDITLGGNAGDIMRSIQQISDDEYLFGGESFSDAGYDKSDPNEGDADFWIVKISTGNESSCDLPVGTYASDVTDASAFVHWNSVSSAAGYYVVYRPVANSNWHRVAAGNNFKKLTGLSDNTEYVWRVKSLCGISPLEASLWSSPEIFTTLPLREESENNEGDISLNVFPNPFSSSSVVSFSLAENSHVIIDLSSIDGKKLMIIVNENYTQGDHKVAFNRQSLPPGIYLIRLKNERAILNSRIVVE